MGRPFPSSVTGKVNKGFNVFFTFPILDLIFTLYRGRSVIEFFMRNKLPWTLRFCVFGSPLFVTFDTGFQILGGTGLVGSVLLAFQDVNEIGHGIVLRLEHLPVK